MRAVKFAAVGLLTALIIWSESTAADIVAADAEGWHTWQLDGVEPDAVMCCFTSQSGSRPQKGCNLDGGRVSFDDNGDCSAEAGHIQVYARLKDGRPAKIRVLSSECPVTTNTAVTFHGVVSAEDNIKWFRGVVENSRTSQDVRVEALFGLVQSESDAAFEYLDRLLSRHR